MDAPEWNDGYTTEGCDRLHVIMCNLSDYLVEHPAIVKAGAEIEVQDALDNLMEAYQKVGRL